MILNLTALKEYERLINAVYTKKTGIRKMDALYFDFDNKKIYSHNDYMLSAIDFDFTLEFPEEEVFNTFFDIKKLFIILNNFSLETVILKYNNKIPMFISKKDSFTIEFLLEDDTTLNSGLFSLNEENATTFPITNNLIKTIHEAYQFVDQTKDNQFNSVALTSSGVYGVTPSRFYDNSQSYLSSLTEDNYITIHRDVAKFMSALREEDNSTCYYSQGKIQFISEKFKFVFAIPYQHTIVPSDNDKASAYSMDTKMTIDKKLLAETLKFFDPFYSLDSKPIRFTIVNSIELEISTVSDFDQIKKVIPITINDNNIVGFNAEYNGEIIKLALATIDDPNTDLYVSFDKPGMLVSAKDNTEKKILIMKYQEN